LEKWPYLTDKCRASRNNYKLGPFLTKTPRCLGFLVFNILWVLHRWLGEVEESGVASAEQVVQSIMVEDVGVTLGRREATHRSM
jgi:hypothetical protein